jgi:FAS-associated factor 2
MDVTDTDPMANLSPEQANTLLSFAEITSIEDMNLCRSIVAQNNWNLDVAVENFINNRTGDTNAPSHSRNTDRSRDQPAQEAGGGGGGGLFDFITSPLRWLFQTTPISLSPDQDTSQFVDKFQLEYGRGADARLNMERTSYAHAVQKAHRESKFLLVYLHSPLHDDTDRFCSQVLCSDNVLRLVNGNNNNNNSGLHDERDDTGEARSSEVVTWAGQVWDPEAYNLSMDLNAASFPFMALLVCQSDRAVRVLDRIQGFIEDTPLLERLQHSMAATRAEMDRIRNEQVMRSVESNLRVEQDREYLEAMETDRQQQREAQRVREAEEQAALEEEQRREMQEAMALSTRLSKESALTKKRAVLQRETPSGSDSALVRFQLPQGIKVSQTFWKTDPVEFLYDFLSVHFADNDIPIENFMVSTNFPKKDLTDRTLTVLEVGLFPRGALFVHNLDS